MPLGDAATVLLVATRDFLPFLSSVDVNCAALSLFARGVVSIPLLFVLCKVGLALARGEIGRRLGDGVRPPLPDGERLVFAPGVTRVALGETHGAAVPLPIGGGVSFDFDVGRGGERDSVGSTGAGEGT